MKKGYLVLEDDIVFEGVWCGGMPRAGEVVFNTAHSGYEEIATDPSYYSQIMVMSAPMQGNYGVDSKDWESRSMWIEGFVSLEMQMSRRDSSWRDQLVQNGIPVVTEIDTRRIVLRLRELGTPWGALVAADDEDEAKRIAHELIVEKKKNSRDWVHAVSRSSIEIRQGQNTNGPRVGVLDFGCKENTLRELQKRCSEVAVFPSRTSVAEIKKWNPSGLLLSNGPGDPSAVEIAVDTVRDLLGWKPIFGICMGHQILSLALGARTYKLKFGHRGSNHPVRDLLLNQIYVTSQNHGYAVDPTSLPEGVKVTHVNLNDQTIEGVEFLAKSCWSVQFHPESHPGPNEAVKLFDYFIGKLV